MQTYREYAPTGFDRAGAFLPDRQDWYVIPCGRNRDSSCLERCNFEMCIRILGGESDTCEIHRFGHWGCGWFEIILVHPSRAEDGAAIENDIAAYPVLSEDRLSEMEWTEACETWAHMRLRDRIEACAHFRISIFAARRDELPEDPSGELLDYLIAP